MELRRRLPALLLSTGVALAVTACIPPRGTPPELPTTTTTTTEPTTTTTTLATGPFEEDEPNNSPATATVVPASAFPIVLFGSQNDSDDPGPGDSDYFVVTALATGTVTATCDSAIEGSIITVTNLRTGVADGSSSCASPNVPVLAGDPVLVMLSTANAPGSPYQVSVTNTPAA